MMLISIIVTSYNYGRYLEENLKALQNQTYKNIEVIVFDDGSTDNSLEIINKYTQNDSRFKLITHENHANKGLTMSLIKALKYCSGEYTAFCESDDYWTENHVEECVKYIEKNRSAGVVVCDFIPFGNDKNSVEQYTNSKGLIKLYNILRGLKTPEIIYYKTYHSCWVFPTFSIVMVKTNDLKECDFNTPTKDGTDV